MKNILTFQEFLNEQENSRYSKIFEESFDSYNNRFDMDDEFIKKWLDDNPDDCENELEYYIDDILKEDDEEDDEDADDEDVRNSQGFIDYIYEILYDNYSNFSYSIETLMDSQGNLKIYRVMTDKKEWESHIRQYGKHLGVYWSWEKDGADDYNGKGGSKILLTAEINNKYIDWDSTYLANIHPNYYEEKEITLIKGTKIKLLNVNIDGRDIDMTPFKDRIFYA